MKVWGASIHTPSLDRALAALLLNAGVIGRGERRFFERTVSAGDHVVDVGANQGVFTLLFSRLVGPGGSVIALEPQPALFEALDRNCRINGAENVTRLRVAAGERRSPGVLHCSRFNMGDNRLSDSVSGPAVAVDVAPLDEIVGDARVDLVKIDVQGFELSVARGMERLLARSPAPHVFFEFWPAGLRHAAATPEELVAFFRTRGFALFQLAGASLAPFSGRDETRAAGGGEWSWTNLMAVRD